MNLKQYLKQKQDRVDQHLPSVLHLAGDAPRALLEAIRYSLLAPGKRLRPVLVLLAAEAAGGSDSGALPAACAVEMVHTYSLVHDDLPAMDDDDLRRGQPTCHKQFGEALAILAGDALLTLAFQVLAESYPPATAAACCCELARGAGAAGMVGGQVEDLAWETPEDREVPRSNRGGLTPPARQVATFPARPAELKDLEGIHARKTGALFRACLRLGLLAAQGECPGGPDPLLWQRLDTYGQCFGQLFQITDDLLDVESTSEQAGKRVHKDAARGKLTYPGFLGIQESRRRAELLCRQACESLEPLGQAGERLRELVRYVLERDR
jgi:geranylgeranyl diphosphate synthase type II